MKPNDSKPKLESYWHMLGPGLTTGAADDDPSGIATYSQAGAQFGFQFLWTALFTFPFMAIIQEMCARIGIVTGRGLASALRKHYPRWVLFVSAGLLFVANTFNIGADLGVMAQAVRLLAPVDFYAAVIFFGLLSLVLEIFTTYKSYAQVLKWFVLALFAYVLTGFIVPIDWIDAFKHLAIPELSWDKDSLILLTAILGTTVSPYLFFWQTSQEVEEQILDGKTTLKQREATTPPADIRRMRFDVWWGMLLSNLVMFFIIVVCAATLFNSGIQNIGSAADAAAALKPLAGNLASLLFTLGIVGTGLLAIPVLAGASSYAITEAFGWREGLYRNFKQAYAFYAVIIVSTLLGILMNFFHLDSIKMLIYSAVLNGLIAPFILALIVLLSSSRKIMKEWANGPLVKSLGWVITIVMTVSGLITIWFLVLG